jgi:hypothetical protein
VHQHGGALERDVEVAGGWAVLDQDVGAGLERGGVRCPDDALQLGLGEGVERRKPPQETCEIVDGRNLGLVFVRPPCQSRNSSHMFWAV